MTQEDKELLLKDLCARLPYGVKVEYKNEIFDVEHVSPMYEEVKLDTYETWTVGISDIKPYLFPLSSMTEEQKIKCFEGTDIELDEDYEIWSKMSSDTCTIITNMNDWLKVIDWLNKHHFDYKGLIPLGLANDATGLNIY